MAQVTSTVRRFLAFVLLIAVWPAANAADGTLEYAIKATYLLKFTKFIEWPAGSLGGPDAPFNICVLGPNPFGNTLHRVVAGETAAGRKIAIQRVDRDPVPGACQVLYVAEQEDRPKFSVEGSRGMLTVGEGSEFARNGGMIGFVLDNRRVTFDINWRAAEASGLKLSSGLLNVAKTVIR